jgi:hypothetical protein
VKLRGFRARRRNSRNFEEFSALSP